MEISTESESPEEETVKNTNGDKIVLTLLGALAVMTLWMSVKGIRA